MLRPCANLHTGSHTVWKSRELRNNSPSVRGEPPRIVRCLPIPAAVAMEARGDWQLVPDAASGGYWWNATTNEVAWTAPQDAKAPDAPAEVPTTTPAVVPAPAVPAPAAPAPAAPAPATPAPETPAPTPPAPVAPAAAAPAAAPAADAGAWQLIPDAASGSSYWWTAGTEP